MTSGSAGRGDGGGGTHSGDISNVEWAEPGYRTDGSSVRWSQEMQDMGEGFILRQGKGYLRTGE